MMTLREVAAEVAGLPQVTAEWQTESEDAQLTYAMEWEELMNRLSLVHARYEKGELSHDERTEYTRVAHLLNRHRDFAARLDLPIPEDLDVAAP